MTKKEPIPLFKVFSAPDICTELQKVFDSGFTGQCEKTDELESNLKKRLGVSYLLATNSATSAESLSWLLLKKPDKSTGWPGLQDGDEILTCPLSCLATFTTFILERLVPKWVDLDPTSLNLDLVDLERKITKKTKAIQVVLWGGMPVDFSRLAEIQNRAKERFGFKPAILVDCAHAFGSKYKGKQIAQLGHLCTYSFQSIKHVSGGDLGCLTVPHQDLYERGDRLKWYGLTRKIESSDFRCGAQDVFELGSKWNTNDIAATVLLCNLKHADWILSKHRENAKFYDKALKGASGITLLDRPKDCDSSFWIYSMLVERREDFMRMMKEKGVQCSQVHERADKFSAMKDYRSALPTLDKVLPQVVAIPVHWGVESDDRSKIVDLIKGGW